MTFCVVIEQHTRTPSLLLVVTLFFRRKRRGDTTAPWLREIASYFFPEKKGSGIASRGQRYGEIQPANNAGNAFLLFFFCCFSFFFFLFSFLLRFRCCTYSVGTWSLSFSSSHSLGECAQRYRGEGWCPKMNRLLFLRRKNEAHKSITQ
jgi:hypothetical protein